MLMLSGWRWLNSSHRIDQTRFKLRTLLQVEALSLPAIRLMLGDQSEISFQAWWYIAQWPRTNTANPEWRRLEQHPRKCW